MAQKTLFDNPRVTDIIEINIDTPDSNGCYTENPYKVDSLIIYYVERSFSSTQYGEYDRPVVSDSLINKLQKAQAAYCSNPSQQNLINLQQIQGEVSSSTITDVSYFSDAFPVLKLGTSDYPAWLSTDTVNSPIVNLPTDSEGNSQFGRFQYIWRPEGSIRPGDFFMCWTWSPQPSGGKLSQTTRFTIEGDPRAVITIPTHLTNPKKYPDILERYLPELYKGYLSNSDITPETMEMLNDAIAKGFTEVENLANQLIDLYDANALHESLLVYLSNLFNLKLKSSDPTLWRRQIKEAVPLFKQKGTKIGLGRAFSQSGMVLNAVKNLWQIVSPYTWQESFRVRDTLTWRLSYNPILPIDVDNFELAVRRQGHSTYTIVPNNNVEFASSECSLYTDMTWPGPNPPLPGDAIRVLYPYKAVPVSQQTTENYIRSLQLADLRDEFDQLYPLKNWNVRVIQEDDPMFDVLVPVRHPFHELLVFGKIRTEFPYSENIYNMEEYNGSTRESLNPCDIDKDFVDPCGSCMSSKFTLDLGVQELCNDRIQEVYEIIRENVPFHAQVHSVNISGEVVEFVPAPVEAVEALVDIRGNEYLLTGNANPIFTRVIEDGLTTWRVNRNDAASSQLVYSGSGTAYNGYIAFIAPLHSLDRIGVRPGSHSLEILSPSPNSGTYQIQPVEGSVAKLLTSITEPLNQSGFTYRLSNINYNTNIATITNMDLHVLYDTAFDFVSLGVQGEWDVANIPDYSGGIWRVVISSISYNVYTVLPDGGVVLNQSSPTLPGSSTTVSYTLINPQSVVVANSTTGNLDVTQRAQVDLQDAGITDLKQYVVTGDYIQYSGQDYLVCGISDDKIIIDGYNSGNVGGATIAIRRRLINLATGYLGYSGLELNTSVNHETGLGILNGSNPPAGDPTDNSLWKENFMFLIGNDYFKIAIIDGTHVVLDGVPIDWKTLGAGGTVVDYDIYHFTKEAVSIDWVTLNAAPWSSPQIGDGIDRSGKDPVIVEMLTQEEVSVGALQLSSGTHIEEIVQVEEGISFEVEWKDGRKTQGDII